MLKVKPTDSAGVRTIKLLMQGFTLGAVASLVIGFGEGYFSASGQYQGVLDWFKSDDFLTLILWVVRGLGGLAILLSLVYLIQVRKGLPSYEAASDDGLLDDLYRQLNLKHSYATIYSSFSAMFAFVGLVLAYRMTFGSASETIDFPLMDFAFLGIAIAVQMHLLSLYKRIRGIEMSTVPTLKELKNNAMQMDEAELLANYKMAFDVVMNLQGVVLPGIYIFLSYLSLVMKDIQLTAMIITAAIHGYIIFANFKMSKDYFK